MSEVNLACLSTWKTGRNPAVKSLSRGNLDFSVLSESAERPWLFDDEICLLINELSLFFYCHSFKYKIREFPDNVRKFFKGIPSARQIPNFFLIKEVVQQILCVYSTYWGNWHTYWVCRQLSVLVVPNKEFNQRLPSSFRWPKNTVSFSLFKSWKMYMHEKRFLLALAQRSFQSGCCYSFLCL